MREETSRRLSESLLPLLQGGVEEGIFPAASVGVSVILKNIRCRFFFEYGASTYAGGGLAAAIDKKAFFDLASLTKPLATTLAVMRLLTTGDVRLEDPLPVLLKTEVPLPKRKITLRHLLCHASGLAAYQPYFRKLVNIEPDRREKAVQDWILAEPLAYRTGEKAVYSDLGFLLLGFMIEKKSGQLLDNFVEHMIMQPLGLEEDIFFNRLSRPPKTGFFLPTEDCTWRKKILRGEVQDDNAYCLDGVAGHAGLFGNAQGVLFLTELLLECLKGGKNKVGFGRKEAQLFLTRQQDIPGSTWALGFDTPSRENSSSGSYFSPASIGHLGFTGTSFWIDPEKEVSIVLLTNRVHPDRENTKIRRFRPILHDRIMEGLRLV